MLKVLGHEVLYRAERFHAAFPSIARFSDDRLLLAFRRARNGLWLLAPDKRAGLDPINRMDHIDSRSHLALMELDAQGNRQSDDIDVMPMDPEAGDQDPSLLILPGDQVLIAAGAWYPLPSDITEVLLARKPPDERQPGCRYLFWGCHTGLRERAPGKWKAHHRWIQPDGGYGGPLREGSKQSAAGAVRGQPLWFDDEVLLPLYDGPQQGCGLFASRDRGESWAYRARLAYDPQQKVTFQEPALCADGRGGMVSFLRTADADGRLATSRSADGVEWTEPKLHDLVGHPFHPLPLADGRVLLSYGYRTQPFGIRVRVLPDALADPDDAQEFVVRDDGLCSDIGYPWGVQLADGRILLVYYWTDPEGVRMIMGSWLEIVD